MTACPPLPVNSGDATVTAASVRSAGADVHRTVVVVARRGTSRSPSHGGVKGQSTTSRRHGNSTHLESENRFWLRQFAKHISKLGWLGSRVVSVLD